MMQDKETKYFEMRVGNIHKSTATLVDLDYNLVELPSCMLPNGVKPGSIIKITLVRDEDEEKKRDLEVDRICKKVRKGLTSTSNKILDQNT